MTIQPPALTPKQFFSTENYAWIESLVPQEGTEFEPISDDENLVGFCAELATQILLGNSDEFEDLLEQYDGSVNRYRRIPEFARLMKLGLEYGVADGSGTCANYLGAAYYGGTFVEQDYASAKELYEIAESRGIVQAMVNLGYIYEYGRVGVPNHEKAYCQYAKAAALSDSHEALYKLGDMYSRGTVDGRNMNIAYYLYERSLDMADDDFVAASQPAIRIAQIIVDPDCTELGIVHNPVRALELFQLAERGLRVDIAMGATCYRKRLQEALEGQQRARELIEEAFADVDDDPGEA